MVDKPRIYPHPSIISNCLNCQSIRTKSKNKVVISTRCARYKQEVDTRSAINGRFPDFCKLYGDNGIDRDRIYPDPIKIYCCVNCPANRRDPDSKEAPFKYKCFEYNQYIDFKDALYGHFPSFCELKEA
jgi:hypothetical protein